MIQSSKSLKTAFASIGSDIDPGEIPDIDLYMDQIITLFEKKLAGNSEKPLTKSMINNYSRENLIRAVTGKKYNRVQIIQMLIVYNLKQIMSMNEIGRMFDILEESGISYEKFYELMLEVKGTLNGPAAHSPEQTGSIAEQFGNRAMHYAGTEGKAPSEEEDALKSFLFCTLFSASCKTAADDIIDRMRRNIT